MSFQKEKKKKKKRKKAVMVDLEQRRKMAKRK
jgi:hypothetical protein